jgi:hypothetical protein
MMNPFKVDWNPTARTRSLLSASGRFSGRGVFLLVVDRGHGWDSCNPPAWRASGRRRYRVPLAPSIVRLFAGLAYLPVAQSRDWCRPIASVIIFSSAVWGLRDAQPADAAVTS